MRDGGGLEDLPRAEAAPDERTPRADVAHRLHRTPFLVEEDGVDLLGYEMWSPIDIVSASTGEMDKRYGFVFVNKNNAGEGDMSRSRKKSFYWYKKVIETNGADLD